MRPGCATCAAMGAEGIDRRRGPGSAEVGGDGPRSASRPARCLPDYRIPVYRIPVYRIPDPETYLLAT